MRSYLPSRSSTRFGARPRRQRLARRFRSPSRGCARYSVPECWRRGLLATSFASRTASSTCSALKDWSPKASKCSPPAGRAAVLLRNALTLWRGPALVDVMYESFAQGEAGQLEELRLSCLEERIEADLALGRHADLVGELKVLIDRHPYRERLCGRLMLALYRSGRQAEALGLYRRSRDRWVDDLGIEPGPELRSLASRILNQDSSLAWAPRPTSSGEVTEPTGAFVGRERSPSCWSWRTCTRRMSRLFCSCVSLRGLSPTRACWSLRQHAAATVQRLSRSPTPWRTWREPNVSATFAADGDHGAGRCRGRGRQPRAGQDAL
jgi:hypothetical protein